MYKFILYITVCLFYTCRSKGWLEWRDIGERKAMGKQCRRKSKEHGGKERHRDDQVESQKRRERGAQLAQTTVSDGCVHVYTLYTYNMYKL